MAVNLEQELRKAQRNLREAHDEIERLDRIEVKYNNLCDVLNELTDENAKLQAVVDAMERGLRTIAGMAESDYIESVALEALSP
jgi:predicted nuclease with TOPRIM domain